MTKTTTMIHYKMYWKIGTFSSPDKKYILGQQSVHRIKFAHCLFN